MSACVKNQSPHCYYILQKKKAKDLETTFQHFNEAEKKKKKEEKKLTHIKIHDHRGNPAPAWMAGDAGGPPSSAGEDELKGDKKGKKKF